MTYLHHLLLYITNVRHTPNIKSVSAGVSKSRFKHKGMPGNNGRNVGNCLSPWSRSNILICAYIDVTTIVVTRLLQWDQDPFG